jgi:hypothetical protein
MLTMVERWICDSCGLVYEYADEGVRGRSYYDIALALPIGWASEGGREICAVCAAKKRAE